MTLVLIPLAALALSWVAWLLWPEGSTRDSESPRAPSGAPAERPDLSRGSPRSGPPAPIATEKAPSDRGPRPDSTPPSAESLASARYQELLRDPPHWSGRTLDHAGQPLGGVEVALFAVRARKTYDVGHRRGDMLDRVTSGNGGRFRGERTLEPGLVYALLAEAPGYAPNWAGPIDPLADASVEVDIYLPRLESELPLRGRVVGPQGEPVAGARIEVGRLDDHGAAVPALSADRGVVTSDNEGRFELAPIGEISATYRLTVEAPGFARWRRQQLRWPRQEDSEVRVQLAAAARARGRVLTKEGHPVDGAIVRLLRARSGGRNSEGGSVISTRVVAGADGRFDCRDLEPGRYLARARDAGGPFGPTQSVRLPASDITVTAGDPAAIVVRLVAEQGPAVRKARIVWRSLPGGDRPAAWIRADAAEIEPGTYATEPPAAGVWRLWARDGAGRFGRSPALEVTADSRLEVTVTLRAGATIRGRIVDAADNRGLAGATVRLQPMSRGGEGQTWPAALTPPEVRALEDGSFLIPGGPPGRFRLEARAAGYVEGSSPGFSVAAGEGLAVAPLALEPAGRILGRVLDEAGRPDASALVQVVSAEPGAQDGARTLGTDSEGRFALAGLAPGRWRLRIIESRGRLLAPPQAPWTGNRGGQIVEVRLGKPTNVEMKAR